ncbi:MAG: prepilin-type N-terminal cleavage/methylation domain-containing protein [Bradymonadales bacterium]|nr:MAG: prepilin-type N-terminal cleavage/methylation domain-containing protein [Bradymonadales bacterium]
MLYRTRKTKRDAFTLLELLIGVAIVTGMAALAYPAYSKYLTDARRSEAVGMLMQTLRAQQEIPLIWAARGSHLSSDQFNLSARGRQLCNNFSYTEFFEVKNSPIPTLGLRFPGARYNLILGRTTESCLSDDLEGVSDLASLSGYEHLQPAVNDFGLNSHVGKFIIGAERNVGGGRLDALFVTDTGALFLLCDQGEEVSAGSDIYSGVTNEEPKCRVGSAVNKASDGDF